MIQETPLTPEWLMKHGFEWHTNEIEPPAFDVPLENYSSDCRLLIERGVHRNQFFVALEQNEYTDGSIWYDTEIWMQYNIGCGFTQVPNPNISEWTVERFCALFYALRGENLEKLTVRSRIFPQNANLPPAEDNKIPTE